LPECYRGGTTLGKSLNWNRLGSRSRRARLEQGESPVEIREAFKVLAFYLKEYDVDTRYVVAIPDAWQTMPAEQLLPYFSAHRSGKCKMLKKLERAHWCRISRATAESVRIKECSLCSPYAE
jgi:hypothetical protein